MSNSACTFASIYSSLFAWRWAICWYVQYSLLKISSSSGFSFLNLACFYFFFNLQGKTICAARKLFFTCHLKFLPSFCWLLSYMKAKVYFLLFSLQLARHLLSPFCAKKRCLLLFFIWQLRFGIMYSTKS